MTLQRKHSMKTLIVTLGLLSALTANIGTLAWAQDNTAPPTPAAGAPDALPPAIGDVVKMYRAGVNSQVILTYINYAPFAFHPTAQDVLRLNDIGIPTDITTALLQHDPQAPRTAATPPPQAYPGQQALPPAVSSTTPAIENAQPNQPLIVGPEPAPPSSSVYVIGGPPTTTYYGSGPYYDSWYGYPYYGYGYVGPYWPRSYWGPRYYGPSFGVRFGTGFGHGRFEGGGRFGGGGHFDHRR